MNYSKGISWFDDCRIPFVDDGIDFNNELGLEKAGRIYGGGKGFTKKPIKLKTYKPEGRFPANLLCSDDMLNDGSISSQSSGLRKNPGYKTDGWNKWNNNIKPIMTKGDKGSNSRYYDIDEWFDQLINELYLLINTN